MLLTAMNVLIYILFVSKGKESRNKTIMDAELSDDDDEDAPIVNSAGSLQLYVSYIFLYIWCTTPFSGEEESPDEDFGEKDVSASGSGSESDESAETDSGGSGSEGEDDDEGDDAIQLYRICFYMLLLPSMYTEH